MSFNRKSKALARAAQLHFNLGNVDKAKTYLKPIAHRRQMRQNEAVNDSSDESDTDDDGSDADIGAAAGALLQLRAADIDDVDMRTYVDQHDNIVDIVRDDGSTRHLVEVRPSLIKDADDGLFAACDFEEGATVAHLSGPVVLTSSLSAKALRYCVHFRYKGDEEEVVDALAGIDRLARLGLGAMANGSVDDSEYNTVISVTYAQKKKGRPAMTLKATKEIKKGAEIIAKYPPQL